MRKLLAFVMAAVAALGLRAAPEPVNLIIDCDIGNDIDDVLALSLAHGLQTEGLCKILAVTSSKDHPLAPLFIQFMNRFYGRLDIPIGTVTRGYSFDEGKYLKLALMEPPTKFPDAVSVMRKALAGAEDGSVVIIGLGFATNLARLLDSAPDAASPLPGRELIIRKVKQLTLMAGDFSGRENLENDPSIRTDLASSKKLFTDWPGRIVFCGWEVGRGICYPLESIRFGYDYIAPHPVKEAYRLAWTLNENRPCWDLTAVLYSVRPEKGYYGESAPGRAVLEPNGRTTFVQDKAGPHTFLTVTPAQVRLNLQAFTSFCPLPPRGFDTAVQQEPKETTRLRFVRPGI